jgi:hypothetical protein
MNAGGVNSALTAIVPNGSNVAGFVDGGGATCCANGVGSANLLPGNGLNGRVDSVLTAIVLNRSNVAGSVDGAGWGGATWYEGSAMLKIFSDGLSRDEGNVGSAI